MKFLKKKYTWIAGVAFLLLASHGYSNAAITQVGSGRNFQRLSATAVSASGTNNASDSFDVSTFNQGTFQVVWEGHDDGSTFELQASVDGGTNFDTIENTSTDTSGATGSESFDLSSLPAQFIRVLVTSTDGTSSPTLTPYFIGKKGR